MIGIIASVVILLSGGAYFLLERGFEVSIPGPTYTYTSTTTIIGTTTTGYQDTRPGTPTTPVVSQPPATKRAESTECPPILTISALKNFKAVLEKGALTQPSIFYQPCSKDKNAPWRMFRAPDYNFEMQFPAYLNIWTYAQPDPNVWPDKNLWPYLGIDLILLNDFLHSNEALDVKVSVRERGYITSLEAYVRSQEVSILNKDLGPGQEIKKVLINGKEAAREIWYEPNRRRHLEYHWYYNGFFYTASLTGAVSQESLFEAMVKTIKFTGKTLAEQPTVYKTYKNARFGFEMQYPTRYGIFEDSLEDKGGGKTILLRFSSGEEDFLTLEVMFQEGSGAYGSKFTPLTDEFHVRVKERINTAVDGLPAVRVEAEQYKVWNAQAQQYVLLEPGCPIVYVYFKKDFWYSIYGSCGRGDNGKYTGVGKQMYRRDEFDKMIQTFKFTR